MNNKSNKPLATLIRKNIQKAQITHLGNREDITTDAIGINYKQRNTMNANKFDNLNGQIL